MQLENGLNQFMQFRHAQADLLARLGRPLPRLPLPLPFPFLQHAAATAAKFGHHPGGGNGGPGAGGGAGGNNNAGGGLGAFGAGGRLPFPGGLGLPTRPMLPGGPGGIDMGQTSPPGGRHSYGEDGDGKDTYVMFFASTSMDLL